MRLALLLVLSGQIAMTGCKPRKPGSALRDASTEPRFNRQQVEEISRRVAKVIKAGEQLYTCAQNKLIYWTDPDHEDRLKIPFFTGLKAWIVEDGGQKYIQTWDKISTFGHMFTYVVESQSASRHQLYEPRTHRRATFDLEVSSDGSSGVATYSGPGGSEMFPTQVTRSPIPCARGPFEPHQVAICRFRAGRDAIELSIRATGEGAFSIYEDSVKVERLPYGVRRVHFTPGIKRNDATGWTISAPSDNRPGVRGEFIKRNGQYSWKTSDENGAWSQLNCLVKDGAL